MKTLRLLLNSLALAALLFAVCLPAAAEACGCGIVLPREGSLDVSQERAILRWDGQTEDIVMALQVKGSASEAAWIMPVPTPAQVQLGDAKMFDFLQEFTKPRIVNNIRLGDQTLTGALPAAALPVTLLDRREIGLYDVSTLAATDATALTAWLNTNGYKFPDAAAQALQLYVDQGWYYIAARISPSHTSQVQGELDPLWMTFKSKQVVYPMRPTALSRVPVAVFLYILADHRMDVTGLHTSFAGWISPGDLRGEKQPIGQLVDRKYFLTKVQTYLYNPGVQIKDDYFASQVADEEYRDVEYHTTYVSPFEIGLGLLGLLVVGSVAVIVVRRRRRANARR